MVASIGAAICYEKNNSNWLYWWSFLEEPFAYTLMLDVPLRQTLIGQKNCRGVDEELTWLCTLNAALVVLGVVCYVNNL